MAPISVASVLISDSVDPRCRAILEQHSIRVTERHNMKKEELMAAIKVSGSSCDVIANNAPWRLAADVT